MLSRQAVPAPLVNRFAAAMKAFVSAVAQAVNDAADEPKLAGSSASLAWRAKVMPLLQQQAQAIDSAAALFHDGKPEPIVIAAEDKRGLAKDLDGFPLDFAGPDHARRLDLLETAVVSAAFQICAAAGIP